NGYAVEGADGRALGPPGFRSAGLGARLLRCKVAIGVDGVVEARDPREHRLGCFDRRQLAPRVEIEQFARGQERRGFGGRLVSHHARAPPQVSPTKWRMSRLAMACRPGTERPSGC